MTRHVVLGAVSETGKPLHLDLQRLVESRLLIQANSGGGKSWTLRRLLEQSHGMVQHLVLDVEGEFHTLRERFDYVLAARSGGDTLADVRTAPLLARRLLELGVSAILDLYELKAHDRVRFVRLFLEALVDAPRSLWHPALIVVDEAHHFCPQKGDAESAGAVIDLMTRGRKRGFCGVLATQRLSKLHKDAAAETNVKLIGRASMDLDMKRAGEELGFASREDHLRLRHLPAGRFFAFGPGLSDEVVEVQVGEVQTTHPRPGERATPVPPAREKVRKVLAQLADLPKEAEEEAKTAAELRAQVSQLKRKLTMAEKGLPVAPPAPPKVETVVERVEVPVLKDAHVARLDSAVGGLTKAAERLAEVAAPIAAALALLRNGHGKPPASAVTPRRLPPVPLAAPRHERPTADADGVRLGKCETAILGVLAQHPEGCARGKLALLAGYRYSGGFRNSLSALRTAGLITGGNEEVMQVTDAGAATVAGNYDDLPRGRDLIAYWLRHPSLGKAERAILAVLVEGESGTGPELAAATGYEYSGGFRNALSTLRTAGLLVGRSNTEPMSASPDLLEEA